VEVSSVTLVICPKIAPGRRRNRAQQKKPIKLLGRVNGFATAGLLKRRMTAFGGEIAQCPLGRNVIFEKILLVNYIIIKC
jgi:hypothetical protein